MIKFFRRIELGPNLDIEVHDALARAGIDDVARLYGWVRGRWIQDGTPVEADLAMAVEKLAAAEDGWGLALDSLRAERRLRRRTPRQLGRALAEIHARSARRLPDRRGRRRRHRGDHEQPTRRGRSGRPGLLAD